MKPNLHSVIPQVNRTLLKVLLISFSFILVACSAEDSLPEPGNGNTNALESDLSQQIEEKDSKYIGIFATKSPGYRGSFELLVPGGVKDLMSIDPDATGKLKLSTGEEFEAKVIATRTLENPNKSNDVKVEFDSADFSFTFTIDENNNPILSDVVFKNQESAIVAEEATEDNNITPVTGSYKCTNCQDQESALNGVDLNNNERTFNMLLTTIDGTTEISIQALVGSLIETKIVTQENCTQNGDYKFCVLSYGENAVNDDLIWTAVHRYTTASNIGSGCSTLAGNFDFNYQNFGSIRGEFLSDSTCPYNTYFISNTGNDNNTGLSPDNAWKSIDKINSMNIQPGDRILFEGGDEFTGNLYLDENDANNSANPVVISSFGNGRAKINAGNSYGIYAFNTSGIKVDNLIVAGSGMDSNQNSGIYFYNDLPGDVKLDFVEITNTEVFGFRDFGIVIGAWNGNSGFTNVLIENNKVYNCLDVGISSYGQFSSSKTGYAHSNIRVRSCEVFNIKGYNKGKHSGNGIVLSDVQNSVIEHSTVYDSGYGNTSCGGPVGIWYWDADQVTIQYSEVYNMSSGTGCDGAGFDLDGGVTNGIMQYNYSHNNDGAGFMVGQFTGARPMNNISVRYNISQNDAATNGGSVYLFNGSSEASMKNIDVYNNTLFISEQSTNTASAAIKYIQWKPLKYNINFNNNILYTTNGADLVKIPSGYDGNFAGNLYYSTDSFRIEYKGVTYTSLEDFRNTGNEIFESSPAGLQADPLLADPGNGSIIGAGNSLSSLTAYVLQESSPAIGTGIPLSSFDTGSRDFYGNTFSNYTPDIGAYHYANANKSFQLALK